MDLNRKLRILVKSNEEWFEHCKLGMEISNAETNCPVQEILCYRIINNIFEILILIFFPKTFS